MKTRLRPALILLFAVLMAGCASLISQLVEKPRIENQDLSVTAVDLQKIDLDLILEIENPNAFDLPVEGLSADIQLYDEPFFQKTWDAIPSLLAGKKTVVKLPLTLRWDQLWKVGAQALRGTSVPYQLTGTVKVKGFNLPFTEKGKLELRN